MFPQYSFFLKSPTSKHCSKLRHSSAEIQMQVITEAKIDNLFGDTRKRMTDILKYCHADKSQQKWLKKFCFFCQIP